MDGGRNLLDVPQRGRNDLWCHVRSIGGEDQVALTIRGECSPKNIKQWEQPLELPIAYCDALTVRVSYLGQYKWERRVYAWGCPEKPVRLVDLYPKIEPVAKVADELIQKRRCCNGFDSKTRGIKQSPRCVYKK